MAEALDHWLNVHQSTTDAAFETYLASEGIRPGGAGSAHGVPLPVLAPV